MTLAGRLLRFINPKIERQRMELRHMILQTEACAEDVLRTLRGKEKPDLDKFRHPKKANGAQK